MPSPPAIGLNDKVLSLENRLEKQLEGLQSPGQALTAFYLGMRCVGGQGRGVPRLGPGHGPQSPGTHEAEATPRALYPLPICVHPR